LEVTSVRLTFIWVSFRALPKVINGLSLAAFYQAAFLSQPQPQPQTSQRKSLPCGSTRQA
jgi:hypothetical protein